MVDAKNINVTIDRKVIVIDDEIISIDNISRVSTSVLQQPFPMWAFLVCLIGILMLTQPSMSGLGWIFIAAGIVFIVFTVAQNMNAPKGVYISLNSGATVGLQFQDHAESGKLLSGIRQAMNNGDVRQKIVVNGSITNSAVGSFGSFFNNGR